MWALVAAPPRQWCHPTHVALQTAISAARSQMGGGATRDAAGRMVGGGRGVTRAECVFEAGALCGCAAHTPRPPTRQKAHPPCAGTLSSWMYLIAWLADPEERLASARLLRRRGRRTDACAGTLEAAKLLAAPRPSGVATAEPCDAGCSGPRVKQG